MNLILPMQRYPLTPVPSWPSPLQKGILAKYNIELIGAKLPSIDRAEDRELFKQSMIRIGQKVPASGEWSIFMHA